MLIYGLISWDYKPSRTYLVKVATSKEPLLEIVRDSYHDRIYDDFHSEGYSDEQIDDMAAKMTYEELEEWMCESTDYVIDTCTGLNDLD